PEQSGISPWCASAGKRALDFSVAAIMTVLALPLMGVIALLVKFSSPGPLLFRQRRMGRDGQEFEFLKFRTMVHGGHHNGPGVTTKGDARITTVGAFLRKWKLDELPQLFHVLSGKMSLVGPRPDLPKYFSTLNAGQLRVLTLRPGLTGKASICFRHEEEVLHQAPEGELESFYVDQVLPLKIRLDLEYAQTANLMSDTRILFQTFLKLFR
ncbi:MAG TPA: sugar transferase, partial [Terriglobales bacterium]|nr:sugar transferase [Terriglobales bacterium]